MHAMRLRRLGVVVRLSVIVFAASSCAIAAPASDGVSDDALPGGTLRSAVSSYLEAPEGVGLLDVPGLQATSSLQSGLSHPSRSMLLYDLRDADDGTILRPNLTVATSGGSSDWPSWMVGVEQGVRFLPLGEDARVTAVGLIGGFVAATLSAPSSGGYSLPVARPFAPDSCPAPL